MYAERRHYTPKRCARRLYVLLNELLNDWETRNYTDNTRGSAIFGSQKS